MKSGAFRKKKVYFTQVSNNILRDQSISLKAKGLYSLIQSYITIEGFTLYKTFLMKQCKEGERAFESTWKELKDKGYLIQYKLKDDKTGMFYYEYELVDEPIENSDIEKKISEVNSCKNPDLQNAYVDGEKPDLHFAYVDNAGGGECTSAKCRVYNNTNKNNTDFNNTIENKKEDIEVHNSDSTLLLELIKEDLTEVSYKTWIEPLNISIKKDKVVLKTKDNFNKKIIEEKFFDIIKEKSIDLGIPNIDLI